MTIVPYDRLDADVLNALIEEFVTRDGAVHGHSDTPTEQQVAAVLRQLKSGTAVIVFEEASETCTIMPKENCPPTHLKLHRSEQSTNQVNRLRRTGFPRRSEGPESSQPPS